VSIEQNEVLVRRFYDEVLNQGNAAALAELVAPDFVDHQPFPGQGAGRAGLQESLAKFRAAFPDLRYTIEDLIAAGDEVAVRSTWRGTNQGPFFGRPATGNAVAVTDIDIVRIAGGQLVEGWGLTDEMALQRQLGGAAAQ